MTAMSVPIAPFPYPIEKSCNGRTRRWGRERASLNKIRWELDCRWLSRDDPISSSPLSNLWDDLIKSFSSRVVNSYVIKMNSREKDISCGLNNFLKMFRTFVYFRVYARGGIKGYTKLQQIQNTNSAKMKICVIWLLWSNKHFSRV